MCQTECLGNETPENMFKCRSECTTCRECQCEEYGAHCEPLDDAESLDPYTAAPCDVECGDGWCEAYCAECYDDDESTTCSDNCANRCPACDGCLCENFGGDWCPDDPRMNDYEEPEFFDETVSISLMFLWVWYRI